MWTYVIDPDELKHHGIKGQKWGVRRTAAQLGHETGGGHNSYKKQALSTLSSHARNSKKVSKQYDKRYKTASKGSKRSENNFEAQFYKRQSDLYSNIHKSATQKLSDLKSGTISAGKDYTVSSKSKGLATYTTITFKNGEEFVSYSSGRKTYAKSYTK